jgi:hypothetical protein
VNAAVAATRQVSFVMYSAPVAISNSSSSTGNSHIRNSPDRNHRPCQLKQPQREIRPELTVGNPGNLCTGCAPSWCPKRKLDKAQKSNAISEATFVVEREVGPPADLVVEYVGDYPNHGGPSQVINYGGAYRFTATQQIDFHAGFGLTNRSPTYFFGLGYSFRFDSLF